MRISKEQLLFFAGRWTRVKIGVGFSIDMGGEIIGIAGYIPTDGSFLVLFKCDRAIFLAKSLSLTLKASCYQRLFSLDGPVKEMIFCIKLEYITFRL